MFPVLIGKPSTQNKLYFLFCFCFFNLQTSLNQKLIKIILFSHVFFSPLITVIMNITYISCFHFYSFLRLTHFILLKINSLHIRHFPQISQTCPSIPTQSLASKLHAFTHSHTHTHPSLLFIFNPVNQTLLTDDADPHAAPTPSAREGEVEETGTSCGKEKR